MSRIILLPIGLFILAIVGVAALQAGLVNAGEDTTVTNETWTPTAGSVTVLDDSELDRAYYDSNVTVYDENDTEVDQGTDYEWLQSNGTVKPLVGGDLDGDSDAKITYSYQRTTAEQERLAALLSHVPGILGMVLPILAILVLLAFLGS